VSRATSDSTRGRRLALAALALALAAGAAHATTITILNTDAAGEGFNDPTPAALVAGNAGTTFGQQRQLVFAAAAAYWANRLSSSVTIQVEASFDPLLCSPTSGVLGSAGFTEVFRDFPAAPLAGTWYPIALANALMGTDLDPAVEEVHSTFNSRLDSDPACLVGLDWFYGIGVPTPANRISLYEVVLHEIGHGLGFATVTNGSTGVRLQDFDDVFMTFLEDHSSAKTWPQMSNAERAASARDAGDLHWIGARVVAASGALASGKHPGGHVRMYAPATFQPGSSVSHWDTALVPDETMEPVATASPSDLVTTAALRDIGWQTQQASACVRDADTACLLSGRFEVGVVFDAGTTGTAQVMSFGGQRAENDESVFFTFFSGTNFEMGVKALRACGVLNDKHWVFVSGLTDQGWTVTVRDSLTGAVKTYSNAAGHLSTTFADTSAFSCP